MTDATAALWSGASYERVAATFAPIHERVVAALGARSGERALDLACGTGEIALRAARLGADVTGLDISSDQLEKARRAAAAEGLSIRFDEGDCQQLPYDSASFDCVASVFGLIFAASHERAAGELARVTRSGGRAAFTAWPDDAWSRLGEAVGRPARPGDDPREWGREEHVTELLGGEFELRFDSGEWLVTAESPAALWELLSTSVPPLKSWLDTLDPAARADAERAYLEFLAPGELRRPYLLVLGRRR